MTELIIALLLEGRKTIRTILAICTILLVILLGIACSSWFSTTMSIEGKITVIILLTVDCLLECVAILTNIFLNKCIRLELKQEPQKEE